MITHRKPITIADYEPFIGKEGVERILEKAKQLEGVTVCNVNSTLYGGGVAELLMSMVLLMNSLGLKAEWQSIIGNPEFFVTTKSMHNALQSGDVPITPAMRDVYERTVKENSMRMHFEHDIVVIHDPQPLLLINYRKRKDAPWIWRCHIDMANPQADLWKYLHPHVNKYDAAIFSIKEYTQELEIPQNLFMPATDPFAKKNYELSDDVMDAALKRNGIPTDLPIVCQISRYDLWKDPKGVIEACEIARKSVDFTLVMLGNSASDDPEGQAVYEEVKKHENHRVLVLDCGDDIELVNTLQRRSAVVFQKSIREGFGLTVTEAMVKGTPVIGGNVGGIRYQIKDGVNGYLVDSVEQAAARLVTLLENPKACEEMGKKAYESVCDNFLLTRLLEQYLDLFIDLRAKKRKAAPTSA